MLITVMQVLDVDKVYVKKLPSKRVAKFCVWVTAGLWSSVLQMMFIHGGNSCRTILEVLEQLWWKGKRDVCSVCERLKSLGY